MLSCMFTMTFSKQTNSGQGGRASCSSSSCTTHLHIAQHHSTLLNRVTPKWWNLGSFGLLLACGV